MPEGKYLYCILDGEGKQSFGRIGINGKSVYTIPYDGLSAIVSDVPFKEIEPRVNDITAHQEAVETARRMGTVLPIRFGTIFKTEDAVIKVLRSSHKNLVAKLTRFKDRHEFGVKILVEKTSMEKFERLVQDESAEARKIRQKISAKSPGTSYLLKLQLNDIIRNETLRRIDRTCEEIHQRLAAVAEDNRLLKTELEQILLNASYLVHKNRTDSFYRTLDKLKPEYEPQGFMFHVGGPWAPYSFCGGEA